MEPFSSDEARRSLRLLDFPALLDQVAVHASTPRAAATVRALRPRTDAEALERLWAWVGELDRLLGDDEDLPLGEILDLEKALGEERDFPGPLAGEELAGVGAAARELSALLAFVAGRRQRLPRTAAFLEDCEDPGALGEHLGAALEPDGRLQDGASPKLGPLRRAASAAESELRQAARRQMERAVASGHTTAGELTLRGDRFCIPVQSGRRAQVPGVVHDRSATGGTLFIEPLEVVEVSNQLQEARLAVREEEHRILNRLNGEVARHADSLVDLFHRSVRLDALRARARWGRRHDATAPRLQAGRRLRLPGFRHPVLDASLRRAGRAGQLVPLELELGEEDRVLLISGPNAGGKTVALKAVGLAACMAQCGIPLPCHQPPELPVFDAVLLELGDEQSIADALSHFSAHVSHLKAMAAEATASSLVLLDEVGGGTDPVEGVALARAYLEAMGRRAGRVLATTHYGQLKALVHEEEGFRNASMAYDGERLQPLFRLLLDTPGASRALEIAARMGLDEEILERARALVGDESLRLDAVLAEMEVQREALEKARRQAESERDTAGAERRRYEEMARRLRQERRQRLDEAEREAEGIVRRARGRIERLLASIREAGREAGREGSGAGSEAAAEAARRAREEVDRRAERLAERLRARRTEKRHARPARLEPGAVVRHAALGLVGTVVEVRGERITVEAAGRRIQARAAELVAADPGEQPPEPPRSGGGVRVPSVEASAETPVSRVDVRGLDVEDAWRRVDKALDRCLLAGTTSLEVIHGKGTGVLRRRLGERLGGDPRVRSHHLAEGRRGDDGLTVVEVG